MAGRSRPRGHCSQPATIAIFSGGMQSSCSTRTPLNCASRVTKPNAVGLYSPASHERNVFDHLQGSCTASTTQKKYLGVVGLEWGSNIYEFRIHLSLSAPRMIDATATYA